MLTGLLSPTSGTATIDGVEAATTASKQRIGDRLPPAESRRCSATCRCGRTSTSTPRCTGFALRRRKRLRQLLDWVELTDDRKQAGARHVGRHAAPPRPRRHVRPRSDATCSSTSRPPASTRSCGRSSGTSSGRSAREGRTLLVTTQYVGEASYCDLVGLLSDGELLMFDTPQNLRRAAFDGEVIDVELAADADPTSRSPTSRDLPLVIGDIERVDARHVRIVVRDADEALAEIGACIDAVGLELVEATEHVVDYDEAFVRVVERHRSRGRGGQRRPATRWPIRPGTRTSDRTVDGRTAERRDPPPAARPPRQPRASPTAAPRRWRRKLRRAHGPWRWLIRSQTFVRKELVEILRQPRLLALLVVGPFVLLLLFGTGYSQHDPAAHPVRRPRRDRSTRRCSTRPSDAARRVRRLARASSTTRTPRCARSTTATSTSSSCSPTIRSTRCCRRERDDRGVQPRDGPDPADRDRHRRPAGGAGGQRHRVVDGRRRGAGARRPRGDDRRRARRRRRRHRRPRSRRPGDRRPARRPSQTQLDDLDSVDRRLGQPARPARRPTPPTPPVCSTPGRRSIDLRAAGRRRPRASTRRPSSPMPRRLADTTSARSPPIDPGRPRAAVRRRHGERDRHRHRPDRLLHAGGARPAAPAPRAHVRRAVARPRPQHRPVRAAAHRAAVVDADPVRQVRRLPLRRVGGRGRADGRRPTFWLGVPFSGSVAWFAAMVVGVLLASLALGMVLSSISQTESQAVQFAMLTLLAGMFFSGFVLGLDNLTYPVKLISWTAAGHVRHPVVPDGDAARRAAEPPRTSWASPRSWSSTVRSPCSPCGGVCARPERSRPDAEHASDHVCVGFRRMRRRIATQTSRSSATT